MQGIIFADDDSRLAYENLTLTTPDDGRCLVTNLCLEVLRDQRLLIVGPDGSGRTSLMRATAGLWKTGKGRILRPPLERMMFLPQQPYLTPGSLREQLLYTMSGAATVSDERLLSVLQDVQMDSILERVGGLDTEQRDWASVLSLGEQQALAFARLLLAIPDFAFLDEALSALPAERVRSLYELLAGTATTYVSVGSEADLSDYHDRLLQLHGDGTWSATPATEEELHPNGWETIVAAPILQVG